jgi:hypothetical protein
MVSRLRRVGRWLAIIANLLWGSMQVLGAVAARLSRDSVTDSEERVAFITGAVALLSIIVLLWDGKKERR